MFKKIREGLTGSVASNPIQKCESLFSASSTAAIPLHLSMEAAIFQGWKTHSLHDTTYDNLYESPREDMHIKQNTQTMHRSAQLPLHPITSFQLRDFDTLSLTDLLQALKATKDISKLSVNNEHIVECSINVILKHCLSESELRVHFAYKNGEYTSSDIPQILCESRLTLPNSQTNHKATLYENMRLMHLIKGNIDELIRLGFSSSEKTHGMLRVILAKYPYFVLDGEMLRSLIQFGLFSPILETASEYMPHKQWTSDALHMFAEVFSLRDTSNRQQSTKAFKFGLGNIVQYYLLLQPFDTNHELLSRLFERIDSELLERNSLLQEMQRLPKDRAIGMIQRLGGLPYDKLPLTSRDVTTLLHALSQVTINNANLQAACTYFLLLSHVQSILRIRSRIERWTFTFLSETVTTASFLRSKALKTFACINQMIVHPPSRHDTEISIARILTNAKQRELRAMQQRQRQLHESFRCFEESSLVSDLLQMAQTTVKEGCDLSSTSESKAYQQDHSQLEPFALANVAITAAKHKIESLTVAIAHERLDAHSRALHHRQFPFTSIQGTISYLHATLRAYVISRWEHKSIAHCESFTNDLQLTLRELLQVFNGGSDHSNLQDVRVLPYIVAALHFNGRDSCMIAEEIWKVHSISRKSNAVLSTEERALLLWVCLYDTSGHPRSFANRMSCIIEDLVQSVLSSDRSAICGFSAKLFKCIEKVLVNTDLSK